MRHKPDAAGDPNAVLAGAAIGSNGRRAIGGLIGDSNGGWRGGYRGSAIGTIIGTIAGAAIANAATAPKKQEEYSYRIERTQPYPPQSGRQPQASAIDHLRIRIYVSLTTAATTSPIRAKTVK